MRPITLPADSSPGRKNRIAWPKRFGRFCVVGGMAFSIDAGGARLFITFLPKVLALGLSYLCACVFHYTFSKRWTFEHQQAVTIKQIKAYAGVNVVTLVTNTSLSFLFLGLLHQNVVLAKFFALPLTTLVGFTLTRSFVFYRPELRRDAYVKSDKVP
jgi:putative flippase GtrA